MPAGLIIVWMALQGDESIDVIRADPDTRGWQFSK
jgi:hypothetical protein